MTKTNTYLFIFILGLLFFTVKQSVAQGQKQLTIESQVLDDDGNAIPGAIIWMSETPGNVKTGPDGGFMVKGDMNSTLRIEADGYATRLIELDEMGREIRLSKTDFLMDEGHVVQIPFGEVKERETVGAISNVDLDKIVRYDNIHFLDEALEGRVSGLLGNQNIRGTGNAVFIVDGIPRTDINLNIEEIESLSVLKDANAGMLYGVYAPNGIILVTTKSGKPFKRTLNFKLEKGISNPVALPEYLSTPEYMTLYNEARSNDGLPLAYDQATIQAYADGNNPFRYPDVDYYSNEFLRKNRSFNKIYSEFSGGNMITQYYANVGWINTGSLYQVGQAANAANNRFNVKGKLNIHINDFISSFIDASVLLDMNKQPLGDFWADAANLHPYYYAPLVPVSMIKEDAIPENARYINGEYLLGGTRIYQNNVYGNQGMGSYRTKVDRTARFNQGLEIDLSRWTKGLKFRSHISLDVLNGYAQSVNNEYAVYQPEWETNPSGQDSIASLEKIGLDERSGVQNLGNLHFARRFGSYALLDYHRTLSDEHSLSGTLVGFFNQFNLEDVLIPERQAHLGLRLAYDYRKKYFLDFSSALVNGYKLGPGQKSGFSPSLGMAWILTDEDFLVDNGIVDYLKLRASAGIVNYEFGGNDYKRYLQSFGSYRGNFSWDDGNRSLPSITLLRAANPDLTFEKMKSVNFGLEAYLFNKSLSLDLNVFSNINSGIVVQRTSYPNYLFNNVPYENYEENRYKGIELGVTWNKRFNDFSIQIGANSLFANSERSIVDETWTNEYQYQQGLPVDALFGLEAPGFFTDEADIENSPIQAFGEVRPGDIKYRDQNNDGIVNENDRVYIGNGQARFSFGLSLLLQYKNLSLFAIGNGRNGLESYYNGDYFWVQGDDKYSEEVLGRWTPSTASTATYPRLSANNNSNNFRNSTFWLYDSQYFSLDRIQLTYELPSDLADVLYMSNLSIYVRGDNLLRVSTDAEKRQLRIGEPPRYRNFALGLKIKF